MFVDPCVIVQFIKKIQKDAKIYQNFIFLHLYEAQHVSGETLPIIRSLTLHWQSLIFHTWKVVGRVVVWRCQAPTAPDNVKQLHVQQPSKCKKTRGCQYSFRPLIMGGVSPKTCWASYKNGIVTFRYIIAFFWIFFMKEFIICIVQVWEFIGSSRMQFWDMCIKSDAVRLRY
jgi:hypothetical protein